jgi:neutral amino acid transport system permease protein
VGGRVATVLVGLAVGLALMVLPGLGATPAQASDVLAQETDESVRGTLTSDGDPVEGVQIVVTEDGTEVGSAISDDEGGWRVDLPGPGTYQVDLIEETLPDGVEVREDAEVSRTMTVHGGRSPVVIFPLGERTGVAAQLTARLAQSLFNGIKFGLIVALASIGLSLVYGTTRLVNFAHGDLLALGAFAALWLNAVGPYGWGSPGLQLIPAALLAVVIGGLAGAGLERGLWQPLRSRKTGLIQLLVISIGVSLVLRYGILMLYGGGPRSYADYALMPPLRIGPITTNARDLTVMTAAVLVLVGVGLMIQRTRLGKAMRAVSDNVDLAETTGIDVKRVILAVWIMAGSLAALGGIFLGAVENVQWLMGFRLLLLIFAAVILGGIGTAFGAMVGGLLVGIVTEMSVLWASPELKLAWGLLALVVVLLVRPQGILGQRERIG